jgi:hypothetical protein
MRSDRIRTARPWQLGTPQAPESHRELYHRPEQLYSPSAGGDFVQRPKGVFKCSANFKVFSDYHLIQVQCTSRLQIAQMCSESYPTKAHLLVENPSGL